MSDQPDTAAAIFPPPKPSPATRYEIRFPDLIQSEHCHVIRFELAEEIIEVFHDLLSTFGGNISARLTSIEAKMSQLSDKIAEVSSSADAAIGRVESDVADLRTEVARLQALVDAGGATPEDLAALDALKSKLDALDPTSPVVLPPEGGTPVAASRR